MSEHRYGPEYLRTILTIAAWIMPMTMTAEGEPAQDSAVRQKIMREAVIQAFELGEEVNRQKALREASGE